MENTKEDKKKTSLPQERKRSLSIFDLKKKKINFIKKDYTNIRCCNCNKLGHIVKFCKHPIMSYGIVLYRHDKDTNRLEYLLICRKHSIGYIEFIRGNYNINHVNYLLKIFKTMTLEEVQHIQEKSFNELWEDLWNYKNKYNNEYKQSKNKFYNLKNSKYAISISELIKKTKQYNEPEWGFPKGRKNINENNIDAAMREMYEETNISSDSYTIKRCNEEIVTFNEEYDAFNNKTYKLIYYIAELLLPSSIQQHFNKYQKNEISKLGFYTLEESIHMIRPYYTEKKKLIKQIDIFIKKNLFNKN